MNRMYIWQVRYHHTLFANSQSMLRPIEAVDIAAALKKAEDLLADHAGNPTLLMIDSITRTGRVHTEYDEQLMLARERDERR